MKKLILSIFFILTTMNVFAGYRYEYKENRAIAFYNPHDEFGFDVIVKGKITSLSTAEKLDKNDIIGAMQPKTKVTVRIFSNQDVRINDRLLVINEKNLVVSKFTVKHIIKSRTFGRMVIGYGNLILSREGFRVVKKVESLKKGSAFIYISRGKYHMEKGDKGRAIESFKKAIELEKRNPQAHLYLGLVYYKDGINNFAHAELKKAYDEINNLYDNQEKYTVLKTLAEIRFIETYEQYNIMKNKISFREEGIGYCKEALKLSPESTDVLYLLAEYYYRDFQKKDDVNAKKTLLKLIKVDETHSKGALLLSRLYLRHGNKAKAVKYAREALKYSPELAEAKEIIRRNE